MKTLDTRDLDKRLDELEALRDTLTEARDARSELGDDAAEEDKVSADAEVESAEEEFSGDEREELKELEELRDDVGDEWRHGVQLIPARDFEDYARELAEEIGAIPDDAQWPCTCIDWEKAADELRMDYSSATFQGTDYLYRS